MFLNRYMPRLDSFLHYRNIDVSSIKELTRRWYPRVYFQLPKKNGGHRSTRQQEQKTGATKARKQEEKRGPQKH